jgi:hypothetical protein
MDARANSAPLLVTAQPSPVAPRLLAAYAIGATLWTPALVLVAGQVEGVLAWVLPGFLFAGAARMFAAMWMLRFALYIVGSYSRRDYGYGINGVIVNPQLALGEKAQRIARDWFGVVLAAVWICFMATVLATAIAGR